MCRKHLKRDSPNGSPPQDADDLFKLLKRTADKMGGGGNGETKRKSRRPGLPCHTPSDDNSIGYFGTK